MMLLATLFSALPNITWLRQALYGALLVTIVAGGGWLVWTLRDQDEAPRIQRAAKAEVDKANMAAHVEQLEEAIEQGTKTLALREHSLAETRAQLEALKKAQEEKRNASPAPDSVVVPAGDPWLGARRLRE